MLNSNPINEEEMKMTVEALRKDMVAAMKAKDKTTKEAVSALISAAKKAAIDEGCRDDIPEALVDRVILKELKTVKEQLDTCPESREDLRAEYQARYDVIAKYAPQQMSAEEIKTYLEEKFAEVLATKEQRPDHESCHGRPQRQSRRQTHQPGSSRVLQIKHGINRPETVR